MKKLLLHHAFDHALKIKQNQSTIELTLIYQLLMYSRWLIKFYVSKDIIVSNKSDNILENVLKLYDTAFQLISDFKKMEYRIENTFKHYLEWFLSTVWNLGLQCYEKEMLSYGNSLILLAFKFMQFEGTDVSNINRKKACTLLYLSTHVLSDAPKEFIRRTIG
ncbi:hypothetical protein BDF14DRAFT_1196111 [Spinellus fusiger]|nr:hypothetical protein BDF14DRAFT_1196111 [Spinellus fusiger]